MNNESSLQRQLTSRINALRKISHSASFETRKMIANGIVMSRIIYVMQVWGGTKDYLIKTLQILQNKAARFVTKLDIYTSQKKLLLQCGWLSVRQLVEYHSLVLIFKSNLEKKPVFLKKYLTKTFTYRTKCPIRKLPRTFLRNHSLSNLRKWGMSYQLCKNSREH